MTEQEKPNETPEEDTAAAAEPAPEATADAPAAAATAPAEKPAKAAAAKAEKQEAPVEPATAVVAAQHTPGTPIVPRRSILRMAFWTGMGASLAGIGAGAVDFLYPRRVTGFGGTVSVSAAAVPGPGQKIQVPAGRFWLVNLTEEQGGPGLLALWWKCPHLGCTVPWKPNFVFPDPLTGAPKTGWFRCPCHGSTYTDSGVRVFGPAPRSLDVMDMVVGSDGRITVNTGSITPGAPNNADLVVRI